jgi:hypothetical protein
VGIVAHFVAETTVVRFEGVGAMAAVVVLEALEALERAEMVLMVLLAVLLFVEIMNHKDLGVYVFGAVDVLTPWVFFNAEMGVLELVLWVLGHPLGMYKSCKPTKGLRPVGLSPTQTLVFFSKNAIGPRPTVKVRSLHLGSSVAATY